VAVAGDREIRAFDDGELWLDDDASPPASPAGWYVRRRKASHPVWIGPFASEAAAADATLTGDPLRDARRRLELWARRNQLANREDGPKLEVPPAPPPPLPSPGSGEGTVEPDPASEDMNPTPTSPAPEPGEGKGGGLPEPAATRPRRRRADPRQIDLPF